MTSRPGALLVALIPLALPGDPVKLHQHGPGPGPAKMATQAASLRQSHLAAAPGTSQPQAQPAGLHQRSTTQRGANCPGRGLGPKPGSELSWAPKSDTRATAPNSATTAATAAAVSATAAAVSAATAAVSAAAAATARGVSSTFAASAPRPDSGRTRRHGAPPWPPVYRAGHTNPGVR